MRDGTTCLPFIVEWRVNLVLTIPGLREHVEPVKMMRIVDEPSRDAELILAQELYMQAMVF